VIVVVEKHDDPPGPNEFARVFCQRFGERMNARLVDPAFVSKRQ